MTRDEVLEKMAFGIAAYFGENDHPLEAALAALAELESAGVTLCPNEPTQEMLKAGEDAPIMHGWSEAGEHNCSPQVTWDAMLSASPLKQGREG